MKYLFAILIPITLLIGCEEQQHITNPPVVGHWNTEVIDTNAYIQVLDIEVDSTNKPHILYEYPGVSLKYATKVGGSWNISNVAAGGPNCDIKIDSLGLVHVIYDFADSEDHLMHATYDGSTWTYDLLNLSGACPSMAIDGNDNIHVAFAPQDGNYILKYAYYDGSSWMQENVGPYDDSISRITTDEQNNPHIVYSYWYLRHATKINSTWQIDACNEIIFNAYSGFSVDYQNGKVHIAVPDGTYKCKLKYVTFQAGLWQITEIPDNSEDYGYGARLKMDSIGEPHIIFNEGDWNSINYTFRLNDGWNTSSIVNAGNFVGTIDGSAAPHIAYTLNGQLIYSWYDQPW